MNARELEPGLFCWQAHHPDWPGQDATWGPDVTSYAVVGEGTVMIDPLSAPEELAAATSSVLVTCAWHSRDAVALAAAGATLYAPDPLEGASGARTYVTGETLPGGVEVYAGFYPGEFAFWIPSHRSLVFAESLYGVDGKARLPLPEWIPEGMTVDDVKAWLAPLVELEPEWFLPTHGEPLAEATATLRVALGR